LHAKFSSKVMIELAADRAVREARPVADQLRGVSAGTGLAMMLRVDGLVMRPNKTRGEPVVYRIVLADSAAATERAGRADGHQLEHWPIGWEPRDTPGKTAPSLFELLNAEIDGYSLAETLDAIRPRLKIPMYVDHAALAAKKIDLAKVQVRMARTRTSYKRVIDRAAAQAQLHSHVRVDEAGYPFLWISRWSWDGLESVRFNVTD
jgi:hypothetical protein